MLKKIWVELVDPRCPFRPEGGPIVEGHKPKLVTVNAMVNRGISSKRLRQRYDLSIPEDAKAKLKSTKSDSTDKNVKGKDVSNK